MGHNQTDLRSRSRAVDRAARDLQRLVLRECVSLLKTLKQPLWVFVHLRSIALGKDGRCSIWDQINVPRRREQASVVEKSLKVQYLLEPNNRTYNELLISRERNDNGNGDGFKRVSFGFGDSAVGADIHFNDREIINATARACFIDIYGGSSGDIQHTERSRLSELRLSIGLSDEVRRNFRLDGMDNNNPLRVLPDEVRYALQILMLWSNTLNWKYIETHHSRTRFDALTGLVITVCSQGDKLRPSEIDAIRRVLESREAELDSLAKRKIELLPRNKGEITISDSSESRLTLLTPESHRLWEGRDVFHVLEIVRRSLFAATFEGVPESYSLIFGHPGFISRPKELELSRAIDLAGIREHREFCEGALDALNVVDVLGEPGGRQNFSVIPIRFPTWAKRWEDTEQAFGSSLEALSSVHQQMVVVGLMCRNVLMVYRGGELICIFNGLWQEVLSWDAVVKQLRIPGGLAEQARLGEIYRLMTRIAYGPSPRSVIIGYAESKEDFDKFQEEVEPFGSEVTKWPVIDADIPCEQFLMRATKTDGAILVYMDAKGGLIVQSRTRIVSRVVSGTGSQGASGTGDATAGAMAKKGSGLISLKISRDGGMKVRWDGKGPVKVAMPMERD